MRDLSSTVVRQEAENRAFIAEIVPAGDLLYLIGGTYHEPTILVSSDGIDFEKLPPPKTSGLRSMVAIGERLILCGEYGDVFLSDNGLKSWRHVALPMHGCLFALAVDDRGAVWVTGDDGFVMRSEDRGETWTQVDIGTEARVQNVYPHRGAMYFTCFSGELVAWRDNVARTVFTASAALTEIEHTSHGLFVVGDNGQIWRSTDDETFEAVRVSGLSTDLEGVAESDGRIFVVGAEGVVLCSLDGRSFERVEVECRAHFYSVVASRYGTLVAGDGTALVRIEAIAPVGRGIDPLARLGID